MVTYLGKLGELVLKGSNIKKFERLLISNTKNYLLSVEARVSLSAGRLYIECEEQASPAVEFTLNHLIGITGWAKASVVQKNIESIQKEVLNLALIAKEKGALLKDKCEDLIKYAREKGIPAVEKTAKELKEKASAVTKEVVDKIEEKKNMKKQEA